MGAITTPRQAGQEVRRRRKQLGLAQCQLAKRSGVSGRSIISLELGDATGIRLDKLLGVLEVLEVLEALGLRMSIQAGSAQDADAASNQECGHPDASPGVQEQVSAAVPSASGPVLAFLQQAQQVQQAQSVQQTRPSDGCPAQSR